MVLRASWGSQNAHLGWEKGVMWCYLLADQSSTPGFLILILLFFVFFVRYVDVFFVFCLFFWFFWFFCYLCLCFCFFFFFSLGAYKLPLQPSKMMVLLWKSLHFWKITVLYWKSFWEAFWNCFGVILGAFGRLFHFFHFFPSQEKSRRFFFFPKKTVKLVLWRVFFRLSLS